MTVLICGVLLWSLVHLFPSVMPNARTAIIEKIGNNAYRGLFALDIVIALVVIVIGWRFADIRPVYVPPLYGSVVITALMFVSFVLFAGASAPGNLKRFLRHPMLAGMIAWSAAHLLANGDNRSVVLFGGLGLWALTEMILISRRDGVWTKPAAVPLAKDAVTVVASAIIFGIVLFFHESIFGVSPLPGF